VRSGPELTAEDPHRSFRAWSKVSLSSAGDVFSTDRLPRVTLVTVVSFGREELRMNVVLGCEDRRHEAADEPGSHLPVA
jgi:hypothetical protein